jgi:predicted metal-dependent hydrolase
MRKRLVAAVLFIVAFLMTAGAAPGAGIHERIEHQQRSIDREVAAGRLSPEAANFAQDNLDWIRIQYSRMKGDRRVGPAEVGRLGKLLDQNDAMIAGRMRPQLLFRPSIPQRIKRQQRRIDKGVASGELTRKEAAVVQNNLDYIKQKYTDALGNGHMEPEDAARLERLLDQNRSMIYKEKHNFQRIY